MFKKRILFITSTFPLNQKDTQVPWMSHLVRKLEEGKEKVDVFAPSFKGSKTSRYFNIKVYRFRYAPAFLEVLTHEEGAVFKLRRKPWLFPVAVLYIIFGLLNVVIIAFKNKYDIVHVNWPFPQGIFGIAVKIVSPRTKIILTFYGAELALAEKILFGKYVLNFIIKKADAITAISNFTKNKIKNSYGKKIKVIPFTSSIQVEKSDIRINADKNMHVLFVGRLIERKGVSYLIKSMSFLPSSIFLDIVGGGILMQSLKDESERLGFGSRIHFYDRVNDEKLKDFYRNCDVFVLPSIEDKWNDTEGLGVVLLEAMSFGKPVVASRIGGILDIVENNVNGLLVPQKDAKSLAEAIKSIIDNKALRERLGSKGKETVNEKFSWIKIINELESLYEDT